MKEKETNIYKC